MADKIKLIVDLPIGKEHGATKGREFEVIRYDENQRGKAFFIGDEGVECAAFSREYESA